MRVLALDPWARVGAPTTHNLPRSSHATNVLEQLSDRLKTVRSGVVREAGVSKSHTTIN